MAYTLRFILVAVIGYALVGHHSLPTWGAWTVVVLSTLMALESGAWNGNHEPQAPSPQQLAKAQEDANILAAIERGMRQRPRL